MLTQKEKEIVRYLYQNREHYLTSNVLADHIVVSDRTVRKYIKNIMEFFPKTTLTIDAKPGYGYQMHIHDLEKFDVFIHQLREDNFSITATPNENFESRDRQNYILNKLLFEQDKYHMESFMEELYVSRSTISGDIKKIKKSILPYQLKLSVKSNKALVIEGSETNKRRFIMDYFFSAQYFNTINHYIGNSFFINTISFEEITLIVLDECREANLRLSDFVIQNIVVHISLAIRRVADGFEIAPLEMKCPCALNKELEVAQRILSRIEKATDIVLPVNEVNYLAIHLLGKSRNLQLKQNGQETNDELGQQVDQALEALHLKTNGQLVIDQQLRIGILTHLEQLYIRLANGTKLENPLKEEIIKEYYQSFLLSKFLFEQIPAFAGFHFSDDEVGYVALHIMASLERHSQENTPRLLVICATGYGSAQMLKSRIESEFGSSVLIADVISYYDLNEEKLRDIDLIVTSIDLSNLIFTIPMIHVSVFLKDKERDQLKQAVNQLKTKHSQREKLDLINEAAETGKSIFDHYFQENSVLFYTSASKEMVLVDLIKELSQGEAATYRKELSSLIESREQLSSFVFSEAIAVPHPLKGISKKGKVGLAIIKEGLAWNKDFQKIQFVFLLSPSKQENPGLIKISQAIVSLIEQPDIQKKMVESQDYQTIREEFSKLIL